MSSSAEVFFSGAEWDFEQTNAWALYLGNKKKETWCNCGHTGNLQCPLTEKNKVQEVLQKHWWNITNPNFIEEMEKLNLKVCGGCIELLGISNKN